MSGDDFLARSRAAFAERFPAIAARLKAQGGSAASVEWENGTPIDLRVDGRRLYGGDARRFALGQVEAFVKKPLRVFLQDGVNDNLNADPALDWHVQNIRLMEALKAKGYDLNYEWGIGLHGQKQGGANLPEMMRWLWRDYPRGDERTFNGPATQPAG